MAVFPIDVVLTSTRKIVVMAAGYPIAETRRMFYTVVPTPRRPIAGIWTTSLELSEIPRLARLAAWPK